MTPNKKCATRRIRIVTDFHCFVKMQKRAKKLGVPVGQYLLEMLCDDSSGGNSPGKDNKRS